MAQRSLANLWLSAALVQALSFLLFAPAAFAADWPRFRGPHPDGRWEETQILELFPASGLTICWKCPVGGGWASPVVAQGKVFVFDVELTPPSARERVHCFEERSGNILWVFAYEERYADWTFVPERGAGPTATPIVEQQRLYAVGAHGYVHCLDINTGHVIWEKHIGHEYMVEEMSCRPSPMIEGSLLICFTGAKPGASVLALDKMTGKEVWKALDDRVSNSSPIAITLAGKRQLIVWSDNAVTSLDPANGNLYWRELMTTSSNDSTATPVFDGRRLLVSGLMMELTPAAARFLWPENRVPSRRILSNTSTPLLQGDYVYSAKSSGELVCLEAATGRQLWSTNSVTKPKTGASIHITPQGGGYFLFTDEGDLIRADLSPQGYREKSRSHLIDPTWPFAGGKYVYAPPAYANARVFARNEGEIVCASLRR